MFNRRKTPQSLNDEVAQFMRTAHANLVRSNGVPTLFTLGGEKVIATDFSYSRGLLPVLVWHADQLHTLLTSFSFGFGYRKDPVTSGLTGYLVNLDYFTEAKSEIYLYLLQAIDECRQRLPRDSNLPDATVLDSLVQDFKVCMQERLSVSPKALSVAQGNSGVTPAIRSN